MNIKEEYQSIPTTYIKTVQYAPTVVLPTQVITEYSNVKPYEYKTSENYDILGTNAITTTNNTSYNYPNTTTTTTTTTTYYSDPSYAIPTNNNYSKYSYNTYTASQPNQNNKGRKTVQYTYINDNEQPQNINYEFGQNQNNIIYNERKTNYPQSSNTLNLDNIFNINTDNKGNIINQNVNYEYYNNNMHIVDSGNIVNQKTNTEKIIQTNAIPNNYYNTFTNPKQKTNTKQQNKNYNNLKTNANYYNVNLNNKANINTLNNQPKANPNINNMNNINYSNNQPKVNIINQNNVYVNNKIIANINNTPNNNLNNTNYMANTQQIVNKNTNNKTINYSEGILLQEPSDNTRKKKKNNENFNKTMPNLTVNNDIKTGIDNNQKLVTVERNSYPIQAISNFEISFQKTPNQNQNNLNNTQPEIKKNNVPLITNNIKNNNNTNVNANINTNTNINTNNKINTNTNTNNTNINNTNTNTNNTNTNNTNKNKTQNVQAQSKNNNNTTNTEYKDEYGNIYVLINGQYVKKTTTLSQNKTQNKSKNINKKNKIIN